MQTVMVSPTYQVVIPKDIGDALILRPKRKIRAIEYNEAGQAVTAMQKGQVIDLNSDGRAQGGCEQP
jgi:bifunctional DNA-binding transcriptional regulator/antitoxin component of YhaV-PrlF toxin-antitoxin module